VRPGLGRPGGGERGEGLAAAAPWWVPSGPRSLGCRGSTGTYYVPKILSGGLCGLGCVPAPSAYAAGYGAGVLLSGLSKGTHIIHHTVSAPFNVSVIYTISRELTSTAASGDEVFRHLVLARIIESASKSRRRGTMRAQQQQGASIVPTCVSGGEVALQEYAANHHSG